MRCLDFVTFSTAKLCLKTKAFAFMFKDNILPDKQDDRAWLFSASPQELQQSITYLPRTQPEMTFIILLEWNGHISTPEPIILARYWRVLTDQPGPGFWRLTVSPIQKVPARKRNKVDQGTLLRKQPASVGLICYPGQI